MSEEIKPCPFCGEKAVINEGTYEVGRYWVCCRNGHGNGVRRDSIEEVVEEWNRRTGGVAVVAQVSLDEGKLRQLVGEAMKNVAAEYAQPVKDALKALEYYGERGEPMPAYVCMELVDDMKAAGDD